MNNQISRLMLCISIIMFIINCNYSIIINYIPNKYAYDINPKNIEGFALIDYNFKLEGEISNLYPYSVFVTLPSDDIKYDVYKICYEREDEIDEKIHLFHYERYMWVDYDTYPCELWIIKQPRTLDKISYNFPLASSPYATQATYKYPSVNVTLSPNITVNNNVNFSYISYEFSDGTWNVTFPDKRYITTLNGIKGFWIPPYSSVKVIIKGNFKSNIGSNYAKDKKFDIYGPAVVNTIKVIDLNKLFQGAIHNKLKLNHFKLYVNGYIQKLNTNTITLVVPAPLILEDYTDFTKLNYDEYNTNIWIDSYNKWIEHLEKIADANENKYYVDAKDTSYASGGLSPDDPLIPKLGWDVCNNKKLFTKFDVPAIAYTTSSNHPLKFAYIVYWNNN